MRTPPLALPQEPPGDTWAGPPGSRAGSSPRGPGRRVCWAFTGAATRFYKAAMVILVPTGVATPAAGRVLPTRPGPWYRIVTAARFQMSGPGSRGLLRSQPGSSPWACESWSSIQVLTPPRCFDVVTGSVVNSQFRTHVVTSRDTRDCLAGWSMPRVRSTACLWGWHVLSRGRS